MILLIKNDLDQEIFLEVEEFQGYDIFVIAREHWSQWNSYTVYHNDIVLERVLNPNQLEIVE